ncbi:MAG: DUF1577 domain-containing protein [Leptospiraceae bacterium]|nr:DUF1577 domain-containing protein [Leptospiraceae bacterium]MCP5510716.1 DUF1577 domain-containing protein [Leptospiraceae bacterium]
MAVGRTDSMQELITMLESIYGETIIGSDINLIKHLFYYLKFENTEFLFEYEDEYMTVIVSNVLQDFVELNVLGFEEGMTRRAKIKFEVVNVLYVFEVIIEEVRGSYVTIKIPAELQAAEMRKYRRVPVDDLFMDFIILFKSFRGGSYVSGDNIHAEQLFTNLFREIKNDTPDLKLMNLIITDYLVKISKDFEIIIYHPGDEYDLLRESFEKDTRAIFMADCADIENYIKDLHSNLYKSYHDIFTEKTKESNEFKAQKFFEKVQKNEIRNFLVSYVIAPITLFDKVIGHVKVFTTAMDKHVLGTYHAEYINEMMEIASYGLTKIAIRGNNFNTLYTNTRIIDISISGLLFEITDENLFNYLKKHNAIKMYIPMGNHTLTLSGEIIRFVATQRDFEPAFRLGVNFFSSNPGDMRVLETYIHEKRGNVLSE